MTKIKLGRGFKDFILKSALLGKKKAHQFKAESKTVLTDLAHSSMDNNNS